MQFQQTQYGHALSSSSHSTSAHRYSRYNVIAQPTRPMALSEAMLFELAFRSQQPRWVMVTHQCPRPDFNQLSSHAIRCQNVVHLKESHHFTEADIIIKAIDSGNASAIIASNHIDKITQQKLKAYAVARECVVFFINPSQTQLH
ncbi:hypothetical protein HGP28_00460 [Vibrio sp. SM6]|uniref:Superfamily II DNA and RNA helicase n=1 Tax=Vibrio agarilyticus TaxID=2726741 RepID=A0A7X8TMQ2_9VIBR|nr:hypothetical protein [Vibrio agarilyticus]NLS11356.1 hypothetical protein [Vibrio agarilyticus]